VKMTGVGTIDLGTKQIGFRVEPKLVMTTEGQGRASEPVGLGIPVMIEGPWGAPRIYPEMQGMLDNPEAAYAQLKQMGKGLFGPGGAGLNSSGIGAAIGGLLGGQPGAGAQGGQPNNPLGGQLGETIGNLLQQGLSGLGQGTGQGGTGQGTTAQGAARPSQGRSIPSPNASAPAESATPATPEPADTTAQQDSQPMNDVLRQLFNR
jgi:AsmA protein